MISIINKQIRILPDVLSQEVSGEVVLLDLNSENYFGLDEIGTRMWQLFKEHTCLKEVYGIILEEYDVDGHQLERDLEEIITKLVEAGLVEMSEE